MKNGKTYSIAIFNPETSLTIKKKDLPNCIIKLFL